MYIYITIYFCIILYVHIYYYILLHYNLCTYILLYTSALYSTYIYILLYTSALYTVDISGGLHICSADQHSMYQQAIVTHQLRTSDDEALTNFNLVIVFSC